MTYVRPKKSLGQHFLIDKNIAVKIVNLLDLSGIDTVLEIGPGRGILTGFLLERDDFITWLLEIDSESVVFLNEVFPDIGERIIHYDFLKFDIKAKFPDPIAIIGNFPYNISSQIFFKLLENRDRIPFLVGMIQKEVAERIAAGPGSKTYGILSVLLQAFYDIKYRFTVNESVFDPPPRVKSAVITLKRNSTTRLNCDERLFFTIVKTGFNQRRKTLRNSLKAILGNQKTDDEILSKRPEQLNVEEFVYLTRLIQDSR